MSSIRKILTLLTATIFIFGCISFNSFADTSNVSYTGNSGDLIFEPGSEHSPTDLFSEFKNVMPGASLTQKITVSNKANNKVKVKIYLRSLGSTDEKFNAFLNQMKLTVTKETDTPLFEAQADKTAGLTDWVCLGTLYSGTSLNLNLTLDVPTTLDNNYQKQLGKIKWQFVSEEYPIEELTWKCPNNENHRYHIEEIDGVAVYVCDECNKSEPLKCEVCGEKMHEAMVVIIGGITYTVYPDGRNHYKTEDDRVHFYLNDDGIIVYYTIDGKKINIKSVSEYKLYTFYECLKNKQHHTDYHAPQTGDDSHLGLWIGIMAISGTMLIILLFWKRKKQDDDKEEGGKCKNESL